MAEDAHSPQLASLANRLERHQRAVDKVIDVHDAIGTDEGPARLDKTGLTGAHLHAREKLGDRIKLEIANRTLKKLVDQELMLKEFYELANNAEETYRKAEREYLSGDAGEESGKKLDEAFEKVNHVRNEIDKLFQPPPKKFKEEEPQTSPQNPDFDESQKIVIKSPGSENSKQIILKPIRIRVNRALEQAVARTQRFSSDRSGFDSQMEEVGLRVAENNAGKLAIPQPMDFMQAQDRRDTPELTRLAGETVKDLVATMIINPDGTINDKKGLPNMLGKEMNKLFVMAGPQPVVDCINSLTSLEQTLLFNSLSVSMKEKLGTPDLDFCTPEDMAAYFENALFDALGPERKELRDLHKKDYFGPEEQLTKKDNYFRRETEMPVELEDILVTIMERDSTEANFAQYVIDILLSDENTSGRIVSNPERHSITKYILTRLIDLCEQADLLTTLAQFYSSHEATEPLARRIEPRMSLSRYDEDNW